MFQTLKSILLHEIVTFFINIVHYDSNFWINLSQLLNVI